MTKTTMTQGNEMDMEGKGRHPKKLWAYAYDIVPAQKAGDLRRIKVLLDEENALAKKTGSTWSGRVFTMQQISHILIVSDGPEQNRVINRRLEAALKKLEAGFALTVPLAVSEADSLTHHLRLSK